MGYQNIWLAACHPEQEKLKDYGFNAPLGTWVGTLDDRAWGKSARKNLFCYFTNAATGEKFQLSVFSRHKFQPYEGEVAFDQEPLGQQYKIECEASENGFPKLVWACRVEG